jgi:hypothetical protein
MTESKLKSRVGEKHTTNEGYEVEIIEYFSRLNCTIQFNNGVVVTNRVYQSIIKGNIKNTYHKSVHGVGYLGIGKYNNKTHPKIYQTWRGMLGRGHYEKLQERRPTYKGCSVAEDWHNFQVFAEWFENNYKESYVLDKDILQKGNKIYSPETCCFVPQEINNLLIKYDSKRGKYPIGIHKVGNRFKVQLSINGIQAHLGYFKTIEEAFEAYKTAKEIYIEEMADKWRGQITEPTYQALINYTVEITD